MKLKYTQTEFLYIEHIKTSMKLNPRYTPPKPSEMTNAELENWYITNPNKKMKSEILARINKGENFSKFRVVQHLGTRPQLVPVFKD